MNAKLKLFQAGLFCAVALGVASSLSLVAAAGDSVDPAPAKTSEAIPWSQLGAKAGADYQGNGLAVSPTAEGARLRCVFQSLEGEATRQGLWLSSTVTKTMKDRFRVVAAAVGREAGSVESGASARQSVEPSVLAPRLPETGTVAIDGQTVRFIRPGLVEEYSVSMDGVRQDFVVLERPVPLGYARHSKAPRETGNEGSVERPRSISALPFAFRLL